MSEFKGTPGPWFVDGFGDVNDTQGITEKTICIAACRGVTDIKRDKYNANLIAAAPELLEALQWAMKKIGPYYKRTTSNHVHCDQVDKANAAIAKALGK